MPDPNAPTSHGPLAAFIAGPGDPAAADHAATAGEGALLDAIGGLLAAAQRDHLELMGRPAFPKAVRKAAKKAAYQLKSAGVAGAVARPAGITLDAPVTLDGIALVGAPGLAGRYWLLLAELPDAAPVGVETQAWNGPARVRPLEHLSAGRLRHYEREAREEELPGKPIVAHADLGLAMVAHVGAAIREQGGAFPDGWAQVLWWCERARAHGADPVHADARIRLGAIVSDLPARLVESTGDLVDDMATGPHVPEQAAIDALITRVIEAAEQPAELTRAEFVDRLEGLADAGCDVYFSDPAAQARAARALAASADVLLASGASDAARQCLWVADQLVGGARLPHELGLLSRSFRRVIDYDRAWAHHLEQAAAADPALQPA